MVWLKRIFIGLVVVVIAAAGALYWLLWASLPGYDGARRVAGLGATVTIVRDQYAIPHIEAASINDAAFGLGFAQAQDRLWQMEINRRTAQGRMSEIFGEVTLGVDKFLRTLGIDRAARQAVDALQPRTRAYLESYAAGVNAYLETRSGPLPPEFLILGVEPEPWQPRHSLGWMKMMAWDLGGNWSKELARMDLARRLSDTQISQFFASYPKSSPVSLARHRRLYRDLEASVDIAQLIKMLPRGRTEGIGSNNWVLSGARTKSGKPIVANDPHLGLTAPAVWYIAHMKTPEHQLIGATLPAVPGIILAHNGNTAWGATNTGPDVQDLYIEKIDPDDGTRYLTPDGPRPFKIRQEIIKVKGGEDVVLQVRESRHGPVISGVSGAAKRVSDERHVISFSWTALEVRDTTLDTFVELFDVETAQHMIQAMRLYAVPQQNLVFADVAGNIGFIAPGQIPIRLPENELQGKAPAPGWERRYDWAGYIPFDELPQTINPAKGFIATANNKIVPDDYRHFITDEWSSPYRIRRIEELVGASDKHTMRSMQAMQADIISLSARDLLPVLTANARPQTARDRSIVQAMKSWDAAMDSEAAEPLIYSTWFRELSRLIASDELGDAFERNWQSRALFIYNVVNNIDGAGAWCAIDSDGTSCDELSARAFAMAVAGLNETHGADWTKWKWGSAHHWVAKHTPFGKVAALARFFNIRHRAPGDTYTLNVSRYEIANEQAPFLSDHGPSYRALYDLGDLSKSKFIHSSGQSGHPLSAHYRDLSRLWAKSQYVPAQTDPLAYRRGAIGILSLTPR
jgi:penicillin amidase